MTAAADLKLVAAPGVPYFTPAQDPPAGTAVDPQPDGKPIPKLFQPIKIRGLQLQNRIILAPLCQYSAKDGVMGPWHFAHLGGIFTRGTGLAVFEASAVSPEGRITPQDVGIWDDKHIAEYKNIVDFAHTQGQKVALQLAHAGRKASTLAPYLHPSMLATDEQGGWAKDVVGASPIALYDYLVTPKVLTVQEIKNLVQAYADGAKRGIAAGFDAIEIHNAHGYLLHSFYSPVSNKRTDEYGGSFENRIRFSLEVIDAVRAVIPADMPLLVRHSVTDWLEESLPDEPSWRMPDTIRLARVFAEHGVDVFDVSSGGNHHLQKVGPLTSQTQSLFSQELKSVVNAEDIQVSGGGKLLVSVAGAIKTGKQAEGYLQEGRSDMVVVGRQFQKNPGTVWEMAEDLDISIYLANQIGWGFGGRGTKTSRKLGAIY